MTSDKLYRHLTQLLGGMRARRIDELDVVAGSQEHHGQHALARDEHAGGRYDQPPDVGDRPGQRKRPAQQAPPSLAGGK